METPLTQAEARAQFPAAVAALEAKFLEARDNRKLKSLAGKDISDIVYTISWCTQGRAYSFGELLDGTAQADSDAKRAAQPTKAEEITEDFIRQQHAGTHGGSLRAGAGRWWEFSAFDGTEPGPGMWTAEEIPEQIVDHFLQQEREQLTERNRWNSLSEEEQDAETAEAIKELSSMGGFAAFSIPTK